LVVKSLLAGLVNGDRVSDLERRLELLPPDLEKLYHKMLNSLEPFYYSHASQFFQLVRTAFKPPTLLVLSYADEEADFAFKTKVHPLTNEEKILRADTMRRRLNSRCKGLLEIAHTLDRATSQNPFNPSKLAQTILDFDLGFDENPRPVALVEKSLADSTIQYLHGTVKDFLELPAVWNRLLAVSPDAYNPRLALCGAFISQVKHMDPSTLNRSTFWNAVKLCIEYAKVEDDPDGSFANLLDELDRSLTKLSTSIGRDGQSFISYYSEYVPKEGELYPHWTCTFSGYTATRGLSFLSLAVRLNLYFYVNARASRNCLIMQDSGLWSLLRDSVTCDPGFNRFFNIGAFPNLRMVTLLLERGADPNWALPSSNTVFEYLLEEATLESPRGRNQI